MSLKTWTTTAIVILTVAGLSACGARNHEYSEAKRRELMRDPKVMLVVEARFRNKGQLSNLRGVFATEGRDGFPDRPEYYVTFAVSKVLKGTLPEENLRVAIGIPAIAFSMEPDEYPGEKTYTLYFGREEGHKRLFMVGAEWRKSF